MPTPPLPRRKRVGTLRPLSEAELEKLAEITPADIEAAAALWSSNAGPEFEQLLDAEEVT